MRRVAPADLGHRRDGEESFAAVVAHGGEVAALFVQPVAVELHGLGEAHDLGGCLRAGAQAALLPAAGEERTQIFQHRRDIQRADALRPADLVRRKAHEIDAPAHGVTGNLQKTLHRVAVQKRPAPARFQQLRDLLHGEDAAGFVVHEHHRHEHRVLAQGVRHLLRRDVAGAVGLQIGDLVALLREPLARLKNGAVLKGGGDDVPPDVAALPHGRGDGPVVGLRAAGGEKQLLRAAAEPLRHGGAAAVHQRGALTPVGILGGGVAELMAQHVVHGVRHGGGHRRGRRVIEINHRKAPLLMVVDGVGEF